MPVWLEALVTGFITVSTLGMLAIGHWRLSLGILAMQYTMVFLTMYYHWSLVSAVSFLVTAWLSTAILALAISGRLSRIIETQDTIKDELLELTHIVKADFYYPLLLGMLVAAVTFIRRDDLALWLSNAYPLSTFGASLLVSAGVLKSGMAKYIPEHIIAWNMVYLGISLLVAIASREAYVSPLSLLLLAFTLAGAFLLVSARKDNKE